MAACLPVVFHAGCKPSAPPPCSSCAQARLTNQWCEHCQVGYVAGVPIRYRVLFEFIDAHGHELDLAAVDCPVCRAAIQADGYCDKCQRGWHHKLAYYSRLTFNLSKGTPCVPAALTCPTCRRNAESLGWCDACGVGMIGNVAMRSRPDFDDGSRGYAVMRSAIRASEQCDACSLAIMADTTCFKCRKVYREGKQVGS